MNDKCFCHLNGLAVKDATARAEIKKLLVRVEALEKAYQEEVNSVTITIPEGSVNFYFYKDKNPEMTIDDFASYDYCTDGGTVTLDGVYDYVYICSWNKFTVTDVSNGTVTDESQDSHARFKIVPSDECSASIILTIDEDEDEDEDTGDDVVTTYNVSLTQCVNSQYGFDAPTIYIYKDKAYDLTDGVLTNPALTCTELSYTDGDSETTYNVTGVKSFFTIITTSPYSATCVNCTISEVYDNVIADAGYGYYYKVSNIQENASIILTVQDG